MVRRKPWLLVISRGSHKSRSLDVCKSVDKEEKRRRGEGEKRRRVEGEKRRRGEGGEAQASRRREAQTRRSRIRRRGAKRRPADFPFFYLQIDP